MDIINKIYDFKLLKNSVYFKITFMLWALLHSLGSGGRITRYFSPIFIIWGGLLLFKNLILEKPIIKKRYLYILGIFLLLYVVTIFYNRDCNLIGNIKTLIWTAIMVFVIFLNEKSYEKDKIFNDIRKISIALTSVTFIISLVSNIMFLLNIHYYIDRGTGVLTHQGFWAGRLWGIYVDPNQGATIAICSILASLIILARRKQKSRLVNIISAMNILVQYIFIILTGSRGGEIAFICVLIGLIYLALEFVLRNININKHIKRVSVIIVACIGSLLIIISFDGSRSLLGQFANMTLKSTQIIDNTLGDQSEKVDQYVTMERPDVGEGKDVSNGRLELWTDGFKLIKYSPILGFGDRNLFLKAKEFIPGSILEIQYVHNGFIHMLLSGGIVAVVTMLIFLLLILIDILKVVFSFNIYTYKYYTYGYMALIVAACLVTGVFLTELFYQNSFISTIFWMYMGFIVSIDKEDLVR